MTGSDPIVVESGQITTIRLENPPLNLVTVELTRSLDRALATIEGDPDVRCVVLTGTGDRAFCAGSDVKEFESLQGRVGEGKLLLEKAVYRRIARLPVPSIAAIQADALGGGLELALCCDLRVADESAKLGLPEVRLGVMPGSGGTQRLPRIVGIAKAKELILMGEIISASDALEIGLVNRVAAAGRAVDDAMTMAETIAERGPLAVREAKQALDLAGDMPLDEGMARELDASERIFASRDMLEGAQAFFEKRPPRFTGE
ncbi:MAG TPA: enoyl-CoA hydratase-related protein [Acidimicrobiia bacterium]|jgi:enoyl-CoA hydratase/carnithine racemase|nr:enoyl-CoA hydratase-related protein [Acidimicrobiia bacterium]